MLVQEFVAKWNASALRERAASQEHFNDICRLLGVPTPAEADPTGDSFTFDRSITLESGEKAFADVWRKDCFAWEYKGQRANLNDAYQQLLRYREALGNPPLLIVSDMRNFEIHTNFTKTVKEVHRFSLDDLTQPDAYSKLRLAFLDPDRLEPGVKVDKVTEDVATDFADIAHRLEARGVDPQRAAHFLVQILFAFFAEDVGLVPNKAFTRIIDFGREYPDQFPAHIESFFTAMRTGGFYYHDRIPHFNGGLFDQIWVATLNREELGILARAAQRDWSQIEPAIFGVLFERSLDPAQRSKYGQFYTSREDIERVVDAVIMAPLYRRWEETRTRLIRLAEDRDRALEQREERLARRIPVTGRRRQVASLPEQNKIAETLRASQRSLTDIRILDPACGSGNFLYVAMARIKDLEKEVSQFGVEIGHSETLVPLRVRPEQFLGLEVNEYAHEITKAVLWIGYLQWAHANGWQQAREPILGPMDHIKLQDALLDRSNPDRPREASWPSADYIIGNPPFLGSKLLRLELCDDYIDDLFAVYDGRVRRESDICCYFYEKARSEIEAARAQRVGLLATNSIRGGANRAVLERIKNSGDIFMAWDDEEWILNGAAVRIAIVGFDDGSEQERYLDGVPVIHINPDLTATVDITIAKRLPENKGVAFMGDTKGGAFEVPGTLARRWLALPLNPNGRPNSDVVRPWVNALDVTRRPRDMWIVDFGVDMPAEEAALYEAPFDYVVEHVKPKRMLNRRATYRKNWWIHVEPRRNMRAALAPMHRYIATPAVSKHRIFVWLDHTMFPDHALFAFARDDDYFFGMLHSRAHEVWSLRMGTWLGKGNDPRYTSTTTFETFPFPWPDDEQKAVIAEAARELNNLRECWLNPEGASEAELKKRTLTNLYNQAPTWLDNAHVALDRAVWAAYAWPEDPIETGDETILRRLLALNLERAAEEPD